MTIQEKIEKIREIVIIKNNPECKTYEEALEVPLDFGDEVCLDTILGRPPITLERLLIALNNIDDHSYYSFGTGNIYCSEEDWSCTWQPNKLLEKQLEGTIEKIYNILF